KLASGRRGLRAQLLVQQLLQLAVLAQRGGGLPRRSQQAHEVLAPFFPQRIGAYRTAGITERAVEVPRLLQQLDRLVESPVICSRKALALRQTPLLIVTRKQLPPVTLDRVGKEEDPLIRATCLPCLLQRGIELRHIRRHRLRIELDRIAVGS